MKTLPLYDTTPIDELAWPDTPTTLDVSSPALKVFTDFEKVEPLVIESSSFAKDAEVAMKKTHVRLKLVVDNDNKFVGVLSLDNLIGPEFMAKVVQGFKREELRVTDFMTPKDKLKAFDYSDVANSTIGNLIEALKERGQQHCLVIDRDTHKIRGLISASDIARKLKLSININSESSFSNIFNVLYA